MIRRFLLVLIVALGLGSAPALATQRVIVRFTLGQPVLQLDCVLLGCTVTGTLDGVGGSVFLVTAPDTANLNALLAGFLNLTGVVDVEMDDVATLADAATTVPPALTDNTPTPYYGTTVIHGYLDQPATSIIRLTDLRTAFPNATGTGIVAVIDTGVDPRHPALQGVLLPGFDFTRNRPGADETQDVTLNSTPVVSGVPATWVGGTSSGSVTQSTAAVVDQSTAAVVDGNPGYADFGHGTMVTGLIHLVAPTAKILPIKAFKSDGTGYKSDILRAIYYAIGNQAKVINMSFNLTAYSTELAFAVHLATLNGTISVGAAGNSGEQTLVYPAALPDVIGVASTNNQDQVSTFSNYGQPLVWVAAPGEGVITTYPFATWAAAWGTSFSTPLTSGLAAVLTSMAPCDPYSAGQAIAHAKWISSEVGNGRIDLYQAGEAWGH